MHKCWPKFVTVALKNFVLFSAQRSFLIFHERKFANELYVMINLVINGNVNNKLILQPPMWLLLASWIAWDITKNVVSHRIHLTMNIVKSKYSITFIIFYIFLLFLKELLCTMLDHQSVQLAMTPKELSIIANYIALKR
jgi:hypothetical protein